MTRLVQLVLATLCLFVSWPALAASGPEDPTSPVATTRPSHGRPQRSEDGRLGGAGRAQAKGRARNRVGTTSGKTTRWIWDGNVPLHEWVERAPDAVDEDFTRAPREDDAVAVAEKQLKAMLAGRPANGPPGQPASEASLAKASAEGTVESPVTWVFEPESFAPLAKVVGGERFGVVTDHLGTPRAMFDAAGAEVWGADVDGYGDLRNLRGDRAACPFRWPGQYEDEETGLYYNRCRYYATDSAGYIGQDPIRLSGGPRAYGYVPDTLTWTDPFGLMPWVEPSAQGHHLVPKGKAKSAGLDHLASAKDTPTFFFSKPYTEGAHEAVHAAQRPHLGPLTGPWNGTADELLAASRAGLDDVPHIRGNLVIPRTGEVLAENVTPGQAFDALEAWHNKQIGKACG